MNDINFGLNLDYKMKSDPDWGTDEGQGYLNINNLDLVGQIKFNVVQGKLQLDFSDIIVNMEHYDAKFNGTDEDFSEGMVEIFDAFKDFFKRELANIVARKMSKTLEK